MLSWYKGRLSWQDPFVFLLLPTRQMPWFLGLNHLITLEVMAEQARARLPSDFTELLHLPCLSASGLTVMGENRISSGHFLLGFCYVILINTVLFMKTVPMSSWFPFRLVVLTFLKGLLWTTHIKLDKLAPSRLLPHDLSQEIRSWLHKAVLVFIGASWHRGIATYSS